MFRQIPWRFPKIIYEERKMKQYLPVKLEIAAETLDDVITSSSFAVKDKGYDTPWVSVTPGIPSVGTPGLK